MRWMSVGWRVLLVAGCHGKASYVSDDVVSDTYIQPEQTLDVAVTASAGVPVAGALPAVVLLNSGVPGKEIVKPFSITNTGTGDLAITGATFNGSSYFRFMYMDPKLKAGESYEKYEVGDAIAWEPAIVVKPQAKAGFLASYSNEHYVPGDAHVLFHTNDPQQPLGTLVKLQTHAGEPCFQVNPAKVRFEVTVIGSVFIRPVDIISCGPGDITVTGIQLLEGASPTFTLEVPNLPNALAPTPAKPLLLPVNSTASFDVMYVDDEDPDVDTAVIEIRSNSFEEVIHVPVEALRTCPTAVISLTEGAQVPPHTNLHLNGEQSDSPIGLAVTSWQWVVQQPDGALSVFVPSNSFPNPTFELNTLGTFHFELNVWDEEGVKSCVPATADVVVQK